MLRTLSRYLVLLGLTSKIAWALPAIDTTLDLEGPALSYRPVVYADDQDPNLFYLPYTHIEVMPQEQSSLPDLSIVYQPTGLVFMARLRPAFDQEGTKLLREAILKKRPEARFLALPLTRGFFAMSVRFSSASGRTLDVVIPHNKGYVIPHLDPEKPASLMLLFDRQQANLMVMALLGSGSLALNYEYSYRAAFTPTRARMNFDWEAINAGLPRIPPLGGLSDRNLQQFVKDSLEERTIRLEVIEGRSDGATLINQALQFVSERCFTPIASTLSQSQTLFAPNRSGCSGTSVNELLFEAPSVGELKAAAGFSVFQLCQRYPELIRHKRGTSYFTGCPDRIYSQGEPQTMPPSSRNEDAPAPLLPLSAGGE